MATFIAGHKLTNQQRTVLDVVLDYLRQHSGDSQMGPNTSPKGDGRWVPVTEIFPARNNHHNALRRVTRRLAVMGVLAACEVSWKDGTVRGERVGMIPIPRKEQ
jgi:hypothetical protein